SNRFEWRYGFAAAGFGMLLGLVQFHLTAKNLGSIGVRQTSSTRTDRTILFSATILGVLLLTLCLTGIIPVDAISVARAAKNSLVAIALVYFIALFSFGGLDASEKRRVALIAVLFVASAVFWAGFEQMGSSFNLFA